MKSMKTVAELIGKPNNPGIEAARQVFSSEVAMQEQTIAQRNVPPIELRRMEWESTIKIINAWIIAE